ncbi:unnamed protein product [Mytilus edulis]|uniref:HAT C-terminal dimerisation domain-containing protein n=1 Tax=Mytilus edulis TaxID=6550 RepID=A0A8S3R859_MYTED|nr:unnamed protein product [Mytilus edulis]
MCSENSVSLSEVYPIVCGLIRRSLKVQDSDGVIIRKTKDVISDELNRRYQPNDKKTACSTPVIASLMDTRYKQLTFLSSEQRKTAEEFLEGLIDEMPLKRLTETSGSDTPPPKRQRRPSGIDFLLSKSPDKPESQDELELQSYLLDKSDFNKSPLEWWSENETKYPRLSIIAKRVLADENMNIIQTLYFTTGRDDRPMFALTPKQCEFSRKAVNLRFKTSNDRAQDVPHFH